MKKTNFIFLSSVLFSSACAQAQIYLAQTCEISFFSDGILEDIAAINSSAKPILNTTTSEIAVKVTIKSFDFEKELMEEHFNEKYLESDKYPHAIFQGKIQETIDYKKDGTHKVTVKGKLTIHGVEKERILEGTITIKGGEISFDCKFMVALKDHNITIPSVVVQNIAEIVEVKIKSNLTEFKK